MIIVAGVGAGSGQIGPAWFMQAVTMFGATPLGIGALIV